MTDARRDTTTGSGRTARWTALWGALGAVALAFPFAAIRAPDYRFPIPFAGYASGAAAMHKALGAVVFYGVLGGFPALLVVGALGGVAGLLPRPPRPGPHAWTHAGIRRADRAAGRRLRRHPRQADRPLVSAPRRVRPTGHLRYSLRSAH